MSSSFFSLKNQQAYRITGIFFAKEPLANCKQSGIRPAVIVSNNRANKHSPVITVVPLTSKICAMERYN